MKDGRDTMFGATWTASLKPTTVTFSLSKQGKTISVVEKLQAQNWCSPALSLLVQIPSLPSGESFFSSWDLHWQISFRLFASVTVFELQLILGADSNGAADLLQNSQQGLSTMVEVNRELRGLHSFPRLRQLRPSKNHCGYDPLGSGATPKHCMPRFFV